ncbi:MAG TPA: hypothetical protein VMD02_03585 [Candidatus Omnitrophota bacterium]|nr:hypothetical protein [Candidatus Omnitrophota bacterium]
MIFPIRNSSLETMRMEARRRAEALPQLRVPLYEAGRQLAEMESSSRIMSEAAAIVSAHRGTAAMFVRFSQPDLNIIVESSSGSLQQEPQRFGCETPTSGLIARTLIKRVSIHVPDISASGIEVLEGRKIEKEETRHDRILDLLPLEFSKSAGAALLTPLGLERSTDIGFGFIFEYSERSTFSLQSMQEAQSYSALFTLHIAGKYLKEIKNPAR